MFKKTSDFKNICKIISQIIKNNRNPNIEEYINSLRGLLFYVGKVALATLYCKYNVISMSEYNDIIESNNLDKLPETFSEFEVLYGNLVQLSEEDKVLIQKNIQKLEINELSKFSLGELYESSITSKEKKYLGQVYTPKHIVKEMIEDGIKKEDIVVNPYFKIIDPACGGGYFLLEAYERIKGIFLENFDEITLNKPQLQYELNKGLHSFIIKNNLWGTDIDEFAVFITTTSLYMKGEGSDNPPANVYKKDILLDSQYTLLSLLDNEDRTCDTVFDGKFDLVIGNPPYIGHKKIDSSYRKKLENYYNDVFSDKADISFCFFKKGYELLKQDAVLLFITSRYFLESPSAKRLRNFLVTKLAINKIIDFQGKNIFKGIGISPVIIKCKKGISQKNELQIYKLINGNRPGAKNISLIMGNSFKQFMLNQSTFSSEGWILMDKEERAIYEKIHATGDYYLHQVSSCNQGIITGCDRAFIVDESIVSHESLEKPLIKPWVKNSNIQKFRVSDSRLNVIYSDLIDDLELYPKVKNHITPYKEKLNNRRECLKGVRQWYQLQWGRQLDIFTNPRILFPFKAETNRFAIVYEEILCSADVYVLNVKDFSSLVTLEYLSAFLNSSLFEFYFKAVGKKVGEFQYDYYPNKIMNLRIKVGKNTKSIEDKVKKLSKLYKELDIKKYEDKYNSTIIEMEIAQQIDYINNYFYDLYELSEAQVGIIERCIENSLS